MHGELEVTLVAATVKVATLDPSLAATEFLEIVNLTGDEVYGRYDGVALDNAAVPNNATIYSIPEAEPTRVPVSKTKAPFCIQGTKVQLRSESAGRVILYFR